MTTALDKTREDRIREGKEKIREAMDAIGARDIAQIRASTITGGPACADCGHNTVHGQTLMGAWRCRDHETCASRRKLSVLRASLTAAGVTAESPDKLDDEGEQMAREERWT